MKNKNLLVCGIGINDANFPVKINHTHIRSYTTWVHMLQRCYAPREHQKHAYSGCSVCNEWLQFTNFKTWYDEHYREGLHLDKDILVEGNKVYSPDTCCFVPQYLNSLFTDSAIARGDLPLGVTLCMSKGQKTPTYTAFCSDGYKRRITKTFKTVKDAEDWYWTTKRRVIREQADRAYFNGEISPIVHMALIER